MKDWFPLTSYDFWAYLTSGTIVLAAVDRAFMGSTLAHRQDWTIAAGVFWAAAAYLAGQIVAIPSSVVLESWLARRVLHPPASVLLGVVPPRRRERIVANLLGAREYQPFPEANRVGVVAKVARALQTEPGRVDPEAAFQCAFPHARAVPDAATRLDSFINQYGMCRNASCACLIAGLVLGVRSMLMGDVDDAGLAAIALLASLGLFCRFLKFYAAYAREVFRTFDRVSSA